MRIFNIVNLDFGSDRLKEFCVNNLNSISASIKSIISQVRVNIKNIKLISEGLNELASKAVVTDENGNVAYGGATIPDDVHPDYFHIFYPNSMCRVVYTNAKHIYDCDNAYIRNDSGTPRWQYIGAGEANIFGHIDDGNDTRKFTAIDNGGKLPTGQSIAWEQTFWIDDSGNVNIKTGSTYTATL
jgi:hypothetical protein